MLTMLLGADAKDLTQERLSPTPNLETPCFHGAGHDAGRNGGPQLHAIAKTTSAKAASGELHAKYCACCLEHGNYYKATTKASWNEFIFCTKDLEGSPKILNQPRAI